MPIVRPIIIGIALSAGLALAWPAAAQHRNSSEGSASGQTGSSGTVDGTAKPSSRRGSRQSRRHSRRGSRRYSRRTSRRARQDADNPGVNPGSAVQFGEKSTRRSRSSRRNAGKRRYSRRSGSGRRGRSHIEARAPRRERRESRIVEASATPEPVATVAPSSEAVVPKLVTVIPVKPKLPPSEAFAAISGSDPAVGLPEPEGSRTRTVGQSVPVVTEGEINELDLAAATPVQTTPIAVPQVRQAMVQMPAEAPDTAWLRTALLGLGGLLTIGSVIRLFV